jgi:hypothetical protein
MMAALTTDIVDHAATKDDRWLMLALLSILITIFVLSVRYLVKRDELKSQRMHESYDKNTTTMMELGVVLSRNSSVIEANTVELKKRRKAAEEE